MRQDANNKVKFIIFGLLWTLGLCPLMGFPTFSIQWSQCDQALMQFHGRRSSQLSEFLKLKATQRILFSGTALLQPKNLWLVESESVMINRANERAQARYQDRITNPQGWAKGLGSHPLASKISFPKPGVIIPTQLPELKNPQLPSLSLLAMAEKIQSGGVELPIVYKTNRSVLGAGIAFIESDGQNILIKFPYSQVNRAIGPFHGFPDARSFLQKQGDRFQVDETKGMAEWRLPRNDSQFQKNFADFFSLFSIDEIGFYDPGIFESKISLLRYENRAYESRFIMALDVASGELYREVTPDFLKRTGLSSARKLLEAPYSKVGASDSVANIWGRESGGAFLLPEIKMYDGLLVAFPELRNRLPEFAREMRLIVEKSVTEVGQKLRNHMPERGSTVLLFEVDVGWVKNADGSLSPYLVESHIGPI